MKIKYLLIPLFCCISIFSYSSDTSSMNGMSIHAKELFIAKAFHPAKMNIIKAAPAVHSLSLMGGSLGYETGMGIWPMSLYVNLRYFNGFDNTFSDKLAIDRHMRLEVQPRIWLTDYMRGLFVSPVANVYSNGIVSFGGGGIFGFQHFLSSFLTIEGYVGLQISNKIENYDGPFYLKYGLNMGMAF